MVTKRKSPPSTTSKPTTRSTTTTTTTLPPPFTPASLSTKPVTDLLDPSKIYITHLDRLPIPQKQTIFLIPILLNGLIALLLLWRLYYAIPTYWILILTLLGNNTVATVDVVHTTMTQQMWVLAKRVGVMAADYLLFAYIGPWPVTFFAEQPANPCSWRWRVGFKEEEIVVRMSRGWGAEELFAGKKKGGESAFWKTRVETAVAREIMAKTGYLMMGVDWDLDFEAMIYLEALVGKGEEVRRRDIDQFVWGFVEGVGWGYWRFGENGEGDSEEERRREVVRFKDVLTGMGKEGLFWKWTEIVEEERGGDGEFTVEGRERVESRVKEAFEKEGVDFEEVKRKVGGNGGKEGRVPMGLAV